MKKKIMAIGAALLMFALSACASSEERFREEHADLYGQVNGLQGQYEDLLFN